MQGCQGFGNLTIVYQNEKLGYDILLRKLGSEHAKTKKAAENLKFLLNR